MSDETTKQDKPRVLAIELLREAALKWHHRDGEYTLLVRDLIHRLRMNGESRIAAEVAIKFKDLNDRHPTILALIANYYSPKLSSQELKVNETKSYLVEIKASQPYKQLDAKQWIDLVNNDKGEEEKKILENKSRTNGTKSE